MAKTTFPGESAEYRAARDALLAQERELRRATEALAEARRALPVGGLLKERYVFQEEDEEGHERDVAFPDLFGEGDTLVVYNFMYGPKAEEPCPGCTSLIDGIAGVGMHLAQRLALVVVAKSPIARIMQVARSRAWSHVRFLSSGKSRYNRDYHGETEKGGQEPMLNVFRREGDEIRHFWGSELLYEPMEPGQHMRHTDTLSPLWGMFDFTPHGRDRDWFPAVAYEGAKR